MIGKLRGLMQKPLRLIPITVFCLLATATVNIIVANINYSSLEESLDNTIVRNDTELWNEVEDIITDAYSITKLSSEVTALKLENSIVKEYDDLNELKNDFDNGKFTKEFHAVLKESLHRDNSNKLETIPYLTIIGTRDSVIASFANTDTSPIRKLNTSGIFTWSDLANVTPNPDMTSQAIDQIMNKSHKVIFTQTENTGKNVNKNVGINMNTLKSVYKDGGIESLYEFSLLAPAYITEDGDIFGTEDNTYLQRNKNHKMILIQIVDLEPVLKLHEEYLTMKIEKNEMETEQIEQFMLQILITTIIISLMLFVISLILIGIHNAETQTRKRKCLECIQKGE